MRQGAAFSLVLSLLLIVGLTLTGCGGNVVSSGGSESLEVTIQASPASIAPGGSSTLTVTASDATSVVISGSDGSNYPMSSTGGPKTVTPAATTTYTAMATGPGGTKTAQTIVTVSAAGSPTVNLTASPSSIVSGGSSLLTVAATNATAVTLTGSDGSSVTLTTTGGTKTVTPTSTTTYTATATGAAGTTPATATTVVTVTLPTGPPTVSIAAAPTTVAPGGVSTLTVAATNATGVTISGSDGSSYTLPVAGGTQSVTPAATTTYTATATGAAGTTAATAKATVTVSTSPAPTVSISALPTTITAGASSTLTVAATNATTVTVGGSDGSSITLTATGGSLNVSPTATGAGGTATGTAIVTVTQPASPLSIVASPSTITAGSTSTLTVDANNVTNIVVTGTDHSSVSLPATGGSFTVSPLSSTTYTATATASTGQVTSSVLLTVNASNNTTVNIVANPTSIVSGANSTLSITAGQANSVLVTGSDGTSFPVSAGGGTQVVMPTKTTTYTATATGAGANATSSVTITVAAAPATVSITANPGTILTGSKATLGVTAANASAVTITGSDGSTYTLTATGGNQLVNPTSTTTYTATATGPGGNGMATATLNVTATAGSSSAVKHVVFMLQENHTFDNYFGMLNPYRKSNGFDVGNDGTPYTVDGLDDKLNTISNSTDVSPTDPGTPIKPFKLTSTCVDDMTSSWIESYGDVDRYDFSLTRPLKLDGFVHTAESFANLCQPDPTMPPVCGSGNFTDYMGKRSMGYYDQGFLNYYYYMASQFGTSDRWFSPMSTKSTPNRIATYTGGTTQGLVFDPGANDKLGQLPISPFMEKLDAYKVTWKIYYTVTQDGCFDSDDCPGSLTSNDPFPATDFNFLSYSDNYLSLPDPTTKACPVTGPGGQLQPSGVVGDKTNSFCIDPTHVAPLSQYYIDVQNGTLPQYSFIEAGYGVNDEHPGSGQSILMGQSQVAKITNALMGSPSWASSVFFMAYDEGGGPYDHVPPVQGHSNKNLSAGVDATLYPDITSISVNSDSYQPCADGGTPSYHCDLAASGEPGDTSTDAASIQGFAAQLGFRVPNMVISPFVKQHYVGHVPMDHTAVLKFVEDLFINQGAAQYMTARDAAQPSLMNFFDFTGTPWAVPPSPPAPVTPNSLGKDPCTPASFGP